MSWIVSKPEGVILTVRVVPRASKTEVRGEHDGALRIRLQAPPVEGKANRALIRFLAGKLAVPGNRVRIMSGENSRIKRVEIAGLDESRVRTDLGL